MKSYVDYPMRETGGCGKICFDKKTAQTKKNWLEKKGRQKFLRIYQCDMCNAWHLTKRLNFKQKYGNEKR